MKLNRKIHVTKITIKNCNRNIIKKKDIYPFNNNKITITRILLNIFIIIWNRYMIKNYNQFAI